MDYCEHPPEPHLAGLIKARWTLAGGGAGGEWLAQQAVPDGCVEIIRRTAGRSRWGGDQPGMFAVGLIERPEGFEISGDARFEGLRLWPWAWPLVSDIPLDEMRGRWIPYDGPRDLPAAPAGLNAIGEAIIAATSVEEMVAGTGMAPRTLQRWFARHVGLPPRRYLRLLRFHKAFEEVPGQDSLAGHAAASGFADQAHMAREFRSLTGLPPSLAKSRARGPVV